MSLFNEIFGKKTILSPTFIKDFSIENQQLQALNELYSQVVEGQQKRLGPLIPESAL